MSATASPPPKNPLRAPLALAGFDDEHDTLVPFVVGLLLALVFHGGLAGTTRLSPPRKMAERVEMAIYTPPPPPPPPEPPPPPPPPPEPEKPKPKPPPPKELPPPPPPEPPPPPPNETPPEPPSEPVPVVTGISMSSTVQGDSGFQVRVGNTTFGDPDKEKFVDPKDVKPYAGGSPEFKAARQSSLTREARVVKDYKGPYPRDLADEGIEGAVVLLLEITKTGELRNVRLARSCGNPTLDKLAQAYIKRFRFAPAEVGGEATDSILRYTYKFELYD